ncbi:MAG: hypothetical protein PHC92_05650 [Syntrophomonadaceae bacterium]|nr:hypothetical protein [Syntrophomonadaceae bacterium]MDD3023329.1 hypothetical protein [Syntrophomonadaceae bacterium]
MKDYSPVHNCYRAILSLVNHLDSFCKNKNSLVSIYEELSELAFYIMEDDGDLMLRIIEQMKGSIDELNCGGYLKLAEDRQRFAFITGEIKTHLNFLLIEYSNKYKQ